MSGKVILASVLITVLVISPVVYFVLPLLYPGMKEEITDENLLLQSIYMEFDTQAILYDANLTSLLIPDTETIITTQGNSSLIVMFDCFSLVQLSDIFTGSVSFFINLVVEGVGNLTSMIYFLDLAPATGDYRFFSEDITIIFTTQTLSAGNYTVGVYWYSGIDVAGDNALWLNIDTYVDYPRSLWIQEIRS